MNFSTTTSTATTGRSSYLRYLLVAFTIIISASLVLHGLDSIFASSTSTKSISLLASTTESKQEQQKQHQAERKNSHNSSSSSSNIKTKKYSDYFTSEEDFRKIPIPLSQEFIDSPMRTRYELLKKLTHEDDPDMFVDFLSSDNPTHTTPEKSITEMNRRGHWISIVRNVLPTEFKKLKQRIQKDHHQRNNNNKNNKKKQNEYEKNEIFIIDACSPSSSSSFSTESQDSEATKKQRDDNNKFTKLKVTLINNPNSNSNTIVNQRKLLFQKQRDNAGIQNQIFLFPPLKALPVIPATDGTKKLVSKWLADGSLVINVAMLDLFLNEENSTQQQQNQKRSKFDAGNGRFLLRSLRSTMSSASSSTSSSSSSCPYIFDAESFLIASNILFMVGILEFNNNNNENNSSSPPHSALSTLTTKDVLKQEQELPCLKEQQQQEEGKINNDNDDSSEKEKPTRIAACLITKNRARVLVETIQHHRILGISKFFIYDDSSTDDTLEKLNPFIEAGVVTMIKMVKKSPLFHGPQLGAYHSCVMEVQKMNLKLSKNNNNNKKKNKNNKYWVFYVDTDELILLRSVSERKNSGNNENKKRRTCLTNRLSEWRHKIGSEHNATELMIPWRFVASSKSMIHLDPTKTQAEQTRFSAGAITRIPMTTKAIFNPDSFSRIRDPHGVHKSRGNSYYSDGVMNDHALYIRRPSDKFHFDVVLLHYYYGSFLQFLERKITGRADVWRVRYNLDLFDTYQQWENVTFEAVMDRASHSQQQESEKESEEEENIRKEKRKGRNNNYRVEDSQQIINKKYKEFDECLRCILGLSKNNNFNCGEICDAAV